MAFTADSPVYAAQVDQKLFGRGPTVGGDVKFFRFGPYTHAAGADTGEINLVRLPAGKFLVLPDLSRIVTSQFAANAVLDIGYRAHTKADGSAVNASGNALGNDYAVGAGAVDSALSAPAGGILELDSVDGVVIYATVATANIENGDTVDGFLAVVKIG